MRNIFENLNGLMGFGVSSVGIRAVSKQKFSKIENQKKSKNIETECRNFMKKFENRKFRVRDTELKLDPVPVKISVPVQHCFLATSRQSGLRLSGPATKWPATK